MIHASHKGGPPARPSAVRHLALGAALLLLGFVPVVSAHEGGPRILVSPDRVPPGGVVEIRGEDLGGDADLALSLVGDSGQVELGPARADAEGHVATALSLPADLPVGRYRLIATVAGSDESLEAPIIVEGAVLIDAGQPGEKDEDDPLLIAVPSGWQRSLSGPIVTAQPQTETMPAGSASGRDLAPVAVLILVAAGSAATALLAGRRLRARSGLRSD